MPRKNQPTASSDLQGWRHLKLAPASLLYGSNEYFVQRAKENLKILFSQQEGESETVTVNAKDYRAGELSLLASPSLFGTAKVLDIHSLASMSEDFLKDCLAYVQDPEPHTMLVLHHGGGTRGKKLLDAFRASTKLNFVECKELKKDQDKLNFVLYEFREKGKKIDPRAAQILVAAIGADTAELASGCRQLIEDGPEVISEEVVNRYYGGRTEVTAFRVSDEAVKGNSRAALSLLRHALDTGVEPIPLVGALALRMRNIARVYGSSRGVAQQLAKDLKLAPWQVEQAQRESRRFSPEDLVYIMRVLADTDAQLKGESIDSLYSVEKAVLAIASAGRGR